VELVESAVVGGYWAGLLGGRWRWRKTNVAMMDLAMSDDDDDDDGDGEISGGGWRGTTQPPPATGR
jgi:hypothetical protein